MIKLKTFQLLALLILSSIQYLLRDCSSCDNNCASLIDQMEEKRKEERIEDKVFLLSVPCAWGILLLLITKIGNVTSWSIGQFLRTLKSRSSLLLLLLAIAFLIHRIEPLLVLRICFLSKHQIIKFNYQDANVKVVLFLDS